MPRGGQFRCERVIARLDGVNGLTAGAFVVLLGERLLGLSAQKRIGGRLLEDLERPLGGFAGFVSLPCGLVSFRTMDRPSILHRALPRYAGGSAIGLSATDAYGTEPLSVMGTVCAWKLQSARENSSAGHCGKESFRALHLQHSCARIQSAPCACRFGGNPGPPGEHLIYVRSCGSQTAASQS